MSKNDKSSRITIMDMVDISTSKQPHPDEKCSSPLIGLQ